MDDVPSLAGSTKAEPSRKLIAIGILLLLPAGVWLLCERLGVDKKTRNWAVAAAAVVFVLIGSQGSTENTPDAGVASKRAVPVVDPVGKTNEGEADTSAAETRAKAEQKRKERAAEAEDVRLTQQQLAAIRTHFRENFGMQGYETSWFVDPKQLSIQGEELVAETGWYPDAEGRAIGLALCQALYGNYVMDRDDAVATYHDVETVTVRGQGRRLAYFSDWSGKCREA
jgi:hypothetical protein